MHPHRAVHHPVRGDRQPDRVPRPLQQDPPFRQGRHGVRHGRLRFRIGAAGGHTRAQTVPPVRRNADRHTPRSGQPAFAQHQPRTRRSRPSHRAHPHHCAEITRDSKALQPHRVRGARRPNARTSQLPAAVREDLGGTRRPANLQDRQARRRQVVRPRSAEDRHRHRGPGTQRPVAHRIAEGIRPGEPRSGGVPDSAGHERRSATGGLCQGRYRQRLGPGIRVRIVGQHGHQHGNRLLGRRSIRQRHRRLVCHGHHHGRRASKRRGGQRPLRDDLHRRARTRPPQHGHRTARVLVVLDFDIRGPAGHQADAAGNLGRRVVTPVLGNLRTVYPDAHPVIRGSGEGVGLAESRGHRTRPPHRVTVLGQRGIG